MKFTEEQRKTMRQHIIDIEAYIEEEILPHINYLYETPEFGPIEKWGRFDEKSEQRYTIRLNSGNTKVEFLHGGIPYFAGQFFPDEYMYHIIENWKQIKYMLLKETENKSRVANIINNFEI